MACCGAEADAGADGAGGVGGAGGARRREEGPRGELAAGGGGRELARAPGARRAEEERGEAQLARRAEEQAVAEQRERREPDVRAELLGHARRAFCTRGGRTAKCATSLSVSDI